MLTTFYAERHSCTGMITTYAFIKLTHSVKVTQYNKVHYK